MQGGISLEVLLQKIIEAWEDDTLTETVLPAYMQLLKTIIKSPVSLPPPAEVYPVNPPAAVAPQIPDTPTLDVPLPPGPSKRPQVQELNPESPNAKSRKGKVRNLARSIARRGPPEGNEDCDVSGGGFE